MQREAYIIGGKRTPIGRLRGALGSVRADDLAAIPLKALINEYKELDPSAIDDIVLGCANQAGEDNRNIARMALLLAGLSYTIPGETVNRLCASGMSAVVHARRAIVAGDADIVIAGGIEHMTRAPYVISKSAKEYGNDSIMHDSTFGWRFINPKMVEMYGTEAMGETAENLAELYKVSRHDQDLFAYYSQQKAMSAQQKGYFEQEIVDVEIPEGKGKTTLFSSDEFIRPDTSIEKLAALKPVFRNNGSVTAGNASGLNDGAAALLIASSEGMKNQFLQPIARIVSVGIVGVEPRLMGTGPVGASKMALKHAGLTMQQMDIVEINEAFAVQVLSCIRLLGLEDNDPRINPNGGAIALGHPLGMSGSRILLSAALELQRRKQKYALVTMCVGVGQGYAVILERSY